MNVFLMAIVLSFAFYLFFGAYVLHLNPKARVNQLFFALSLSLSVRAFSGAFFVYAPDVESALLWQEISVVSWCATFAFFLHFSLELTKNKWVLSKWWIYPLIYLPTVILTYSYFFVYEWGSENLIKTAYGWNIIHSYEHTWFLLYDSYYILFTMISLFVIWRWGCDSVVVRERKQAKIIIFTVFLALLVLTGNRLFNGETFGYNLTIIGLLLPVGSIWYSITKLRLMSLTPENFTREILETIGEGVILIDTDKQIQMVNREAKNILGSKQRTLIGESIDYIFEGSAVENNSPLPYNLGYGINNKLVRNEKRYLQTSIGKKVPVLFSAYLMRDEWGDVLGAVCNFRDIAEQEYYQKRLEYLSTHDPLTSLYNRGFFDTELLRLEKSREYPITIIVFDLNDLKWVNDNLGHDKGDEVILAVSTLFKDCFRESDIVARLGGDEFGAILPYTDANNAKKVVNRILNKVKEYNKKEPEIPMSIAIGFATANEKGVSLENIFKKADDRMYEDKFDYKEKRKAESEK
ncbi:GGDEF domain-containing protein [Natranaerofaba carboxydovora]|uniref:histidine kinase N-terminal 7TM domain-containing diguanylate cyclase n=1 Tax=Natranaerofaba carboxydovora TaxID=2742683 RepID=UPI001F148EF6|nr:GGDEF domain-containing protein [Natranaerofaba carboxydovora]UMZ74652.1 putative diguanylate cyclase YegE [Natranaerofaba carboxydovora]